MEIEVLETDESSNRNRPGRSQSDKRKRDMAKFARTKATRVMGKGCENCRFKCRLRISEIQRLDIFEYFWNLEDAAQQWHFIDKHTRTKATERKTTNWQSNRKISRTYYFDVNGEEVKVCQVMFLSTLGVKEKWVRNLVQDLKEDTDTTRMEQSGLDETVNSSLNCQDDIASSAASEEETSNSFADRMCQDIDTDSNQTLPEHPSDFATPLMEMEVVEAADTATKNGPGKSKAERKGKRGQVMRKGCENCRSKCHLKITEAQRLKIFEQFWKLGNPAKQWQFIAMHTRCKETERKTTNWHSNRKYSRSYYFEVGKKEVKVCQTMFLTTLDVSEKWIKTALTKKEQDLFPDRRGKTRKPGYKYKGPVLESIIEHINLFERCQDCYESSNKECLPEHLTIRKMYEFYGEFMKMKQQQVDEKSNQQRSVLAVATERQYRDVFRKEFSLSFHPPRKGQCERCVAWKANSADESTDVKNQLKEEMEEHIRNKDAVREIKDADKVEAVKRSSICLASFDIQRIGLPCGEVPAFYYADKLNVYNFSVFDIGRSQAYCYLWSEEIARRGSNESGSCLKDFVEQRVSCGVSDFRFYSDSCSLLKKNKFIFGMWYFLAVKHAIKITHRFLENGHTLTEGHAVLTDIERKLRKQSVCLPQEVLTLIKDVKDSKPCIVKEVEQHEVYDLQDLLSAQSWVKDSTGNEVRWSDVREVQVSGHSPGILNFRYDFLSDFFTLHVDPPRYPISEYVLKEAYKQKLPLSGAKKEGLINLCTKNFVPAHCQQFYYQLTTNSEEIEK